MPEANSTTPALIRPENEVATTLEHKEILVRAHAFPTLPVFYGVKYQLSQASVAKEAYMC